MDYLLVDDIIVMTARRTSYATKRNTKLPNNIKEILTRQEKPTNCGTKVIDVPHDLLTGQYNANPLNVFVTSATTVCTTWYGVWFS